MKSKRALPSSSSSPASKRRPRLAARGKGVPTAWDPALLLILLSTTAVALCWWKQWTLFYGDAEAHLTIARRIIDSMTPGYEQFGTVWLPLPHLLMLPFVWSERLWRSGLAGAIPMAGCFVAGGVFLFLAARRAFQSEMAGWVAMLVFALNPNLLYLQSTPMTEPLSFLCLAGLLYFLVRFGETQTTADAVGAALFALLGTLTRYEGWFVLPFAAAAIAVSRQWRAVLVFCGIAALGPVYWLAHNWWYYGDALEFYRGYYSAQQIYQRSLAAEGGFRYPGDGDWAKALLYFRTAAKLCAGEILLWLGLAGTVVACARGAWRGALLLGAAPLFYLISLHGSGTPIFVPVLWPNSYYNTRYGLSILPLLAFGAAALASIPRVRWLGVPVVGAAVLPWLLYPHPNNWVCWKESQVNSAVRRTWTHQAAVYMASHYKHGAGIIMPMGDTAGVLREAGIPLRETLHEGNGPLWESAIQRPDLFLWKEWGIAFEGDKLSAVLARHLRKKPRYELVRKFARKNEPSLEIYRRLR